MQPGPEQITLFTFSGIETSRPHESVTVISEAIPADDAARMIDSKIATLTTEKSLKDL